jgi:hypothetical protein
MQSAQEVFQDISGEGIAILGQLVEIAEAELADRLLGVRQRGFRDFWEGKALECFCSPVGGGKC